MTIYKFLRIHLYSSQPTGASEFTAEERRESADPLALGTRKDEDINARKTH